MQQNRIAVSANFKKMASKAIFAIILFILTYLILITLAIGFTMLCGYGAFMLVALRPGFVTIMVGIGLAGMGILVLIFLFKFIFKKHKVDRSNLVEIKEQDEPELFRFISGIVKEVKTDFPKRIYLSSEVNASVFYDSSFWSMILPVRKNLQIGLALVNSVSAQEFKAILAHEFGHFSQRSMKVGSYVYNVNQVIYNMLYENEGYGSMAQQWANVSGYFAFFANIAIQVVRGIQAVLKKVYEFVNISYMSLSREMEFHADAVAVHVAGSKPMTDSLLRLDLANQSYNTVLDYYGAKIPDSIKPETIYPQQQYVMNYLAAQSNLKVVNNLPQVSLDHLNRYNKSKLVIKDQWASHPSTEDRVTEINKLNVAETNTDSKLATDLFTDFNSLQQTVTEKLFEQVNYPAAVTVSTSKDFIEDYSKTNSATTFSEIYNSYYDFKNPSLIDIDALKDERNIHPKQPSELFGTEAVEMIYSLASLESDLTVLKQIQNKEVRIKTFDYDGKKYKAKDSGDLIPQLEEEVRQLKTRIETNDRDIYLYFLSKAERAGKAEELRKYYNTFFDIDKDFDKKIEVYKNVLAGIAFTQDTNTYEAIEAGLSNFKDIENDLIKEIENMLAKTVYRSDISEAAMNNFTAFIGKKNKYFNGTAYDEEALKLLYATLNDFQTILSKTYLKVKRELLEFQAAL